MVPGPGDHAICRACGSSLPAEQRFCGHCGSATEPSSIDATRTSLKDDSPNPASKSPTPTPSYSSLDDSRFLPGTVLAERYRVHGLLGKGGMGEVYRADDLKLGQPVALKFLPASLAKDESRLHRFHGEVRIARQISHANVCRVYDVGEVDGHHFLSMEYVDGEDLGVLLRRIGRMPRDKAVEIARQLCAGLAAAHEQGVLHRDFKPANVMIDGRGRARITDFGLAAVADRIDAADVRSGTPGYMAPEQLAGREVTRRSDIYALGVVLYELFTGKKPFRGTTQAEQARLQQETEPTRPSSLVEGFDDSVERVILRCLEREPRARPASALAVAAALPGGDPLAAALAAGETPSPEMVADAGGEGALRPAFAVPLLLLALGGLLLLAASVGKRTWLGRSPAPKPPAVMVEKAREIIVEAGVSEPPADEAFGYWTPAYDYTEWLGEEAASREELDALLARRPTPMTFWYRQSPRPLDAWRADNIVTYSNPPRQVTDMANVTLDTEGRLLAFVAVPPQKDQDVEIGPPPDWGSFFAHAGLEPDDFTEVESTWLPETYCDQRRAWEGTFPGQDEPVIAVEACAFKGRPVLFELMLPFKRPWLMERYEPTRGEQAGAVINALFVFAILAGSVFLARRNLLLGRGDRRGALRVGVAVMLGMLVGVLLDGHHVLEPGPLVDHFMSALSMSALLGLIVWLMYLALEPFVRRRWPRVLMSWTRLLAGRLRDPLVGRHVLIGTLLGVASGLMAPLSNVLPEWIGLRPEAPMWFSTGALTGARGAFASLLQTIIGGGLLVPVLVLFLLVLIRVVVRRTWIAAPLTVLSFILPEALRAENFVIELATGVLGFGLLVFALVRFGLVAGIAMGIVHQLHILFPLSLDVSAWHAAPGLVGLALVTGLALYGFFVSLAGRPLVRSEALE